MSKGKPKRGWTELDYVRFKWDCIEEYLNTTNTVIVGYPDLMVLNTPEYTQYIREKYHVNKN